MKKDSSRKGGFSLLELMAVMAIVAMLSTLAVTSYFSAIRGMGRRTARRNFTNALSMARQRACIDGCRVSLIIFNEVAEFEADGAKFKDLAASYVVCRELGRISFVRSNRLFDEFADLGALFKSGSLSAAPAGSVAGAVKIYNLSQGTWALVKPGAVQDTVGSPAELLYSDPGNTFPIQAYALQQLSGAGLRSVGGKTGWAVGDSYGIEVMPVQSLPKGFQFNELNNSRSSDQALTDVRHVTFEPDGSALNGATFTVVSTDPNAKKITFDVDTKGLITVKD